ncbi:hypothetical protein AGLY_004797 [Aphis glycines]|uniref:Carboxypeptidase n=1 Tax=Aphis glycines TaxID=307491 RepID=A0A6G0TUW2_APHGL|nr:hypothetical protein AGLY_004797 [Aphis glycines]
MTTMRRLQTAVVWSLWLLSTFVCSFKIKSSASNSPHTGRSNRRGSGSMQRDVRSGYLTVDEEHGSNMFFWFFPAAKDKADAPVVLWLQGGPGASSLHGVFNINGSFSAYKCDGSMLKLRDHAWTNTHSVLYVDNPYRPDSRRPEHVRHLGTILQAVPRVPAQRFLRDRRVVRRSLRTRRIVRHPPEQPRSRDQYQPQRVAIGNGLVDPLNQLFYSEYLHKYGLIDENGKRIFEQYESTVRAQILAGDYMEAFRTYDEMLNGRLYQYPTLIKNLTGMQYYYNVLLDRQPPSFNDWMDFVENPSVRVALHVGSRRFNKNTTVVQKHLLSNVMQSVAPWLANLLDSDQYRVLLYSGQFDIKFNHLGNMRMAQALEWTGAERFRNNATRTIWRVLQRKTECDDGNETDVAGYATTSGPLTVLLVRNAGHIVPADQPVWALDLINRFTAGKTF